MITAVENNCIKVFWWWLSALLYKQYSDIAILKRVKTKQNCYVLNHQGTHNSKSLCMPTVLS